MGADEAPEGPARGLGSLCRPTFQGRARKQDLPTLPLPAGAGGRDLESESPHLSESVSSAVGWEATSQEDRVLDTWQILNPHLCEVGVGGPENRTHRVPWQALVPLGGLHTDPSAWGQTLALNP